MIIAGIVFALLLLAWLLRPREPSLLDEKRELLEYFRQRDAAEARGEIYPPWSFTGEPRPDEKREE